jgi:predicted RNA-binding Zn ribbon-like protein
VPDSELRPYAWSTIGGHLALDLCNTVSWRLDPARRIDRLANPAALADWFGTLTGSPYRDQLLEQVQGERAERALHRVAVLRAAATRVLDAQVDRTAAEPSDIDRLASAWRAALAVATSHPELPLRWTIEPTGPARLAHAIALSIGELVHQPDQSGLRRCDGDGCGWLFLDTTRNHSRRWCDPLDCGNRARVRSYAERHRRPSVS